MATVLHRTLKTPMTTGAFSARFHSPRSSCSHDALASPTRRIGRPRETVHAGGAVSGGTAMSFDHGVASRCFMHAWSAALVQVSPAMMGACRGATREHEAEALDDDQARAGSPGDDLDGSPEGDSEQGESEEGGDSGGSSEGDAEGAERPGPARGRGDSAKRKADSVADRSAGGKVAEAAAKKPRLEVEDDFMKLDDMEAFVQEAERRAAAGSDEGAPRLALPSPHTPWPPFTTRMCVHRCLAVYHGYGKRTEL